MTPCDVDVEVRVNWVQAMVPHELVVPDPSQALMAGAYSV